MAKTITINNFGGGIANDIYSGKYGEFSSTRNFDILSYPNKLFPLSSLATGTTSTGISNLLTASDGNVYGLSSTKLYTRNGSNVFTDNNDYSGGTAISTDFFVEYKKAGSNYLISYDSTAFITINPVAHSSTGLTNGTITVTSIGQGFVHPKDNILYVPYEYGGATLIGKIDTTTFTAAVLTLPSQYRIVGLTNYGNYLAIACSLKDANGLPQGNSSDSSYIYLWDRDTSNPLPNESIPWGDNILQVFNNLKGVLVGISRFPDGDDTSLLVQGWDGGEVKPLVTIPAIKQTTTDPSITFNTKVNFIHRNRLYFSADLVGGSTSPSHKGLWSVGKNKRGEWTCTVERTGSTDGSDVSVLAATFRVGTLHVVHTSAGTLTNNDGSFSTDLATRYASPSIYESVVNPKMPEADKMYKKKLMSVTCHYLPLPTAGQVVMKYRVDSDRGDWTTIFTETTDGAVVTEMPKASNGAFTDGRNFEFRIESTGFAQILGFTYKYEIMPTLI